MLTIPISLIFLSLFDFAFRQNECCSKCGGDCLYEGRVYTQSSGMFSPSNDIDKCQVCVCNAGSVICKKKPCPIVKCK